MRFGDKKTKKKHERRLNFEILPGLSTIYLKPEIEELKELELLALKALRVDFASISGGNFHGTVVQEPLTTSLSILGIDLQAAQ